MSAPRSVLGRGSNEQSFERMLLAPFEGVRLQARPAHPVLRQIFCRRSMGCGEGRRRLSPSDPPFSWVVRASPRRDRQLGRPVLSSEPCRAC